MVSCLGNCMVMGDFIVYYNNNYYLSTCMHSYHMWSTVDIISFGWLSKQCGNTFLLCVHMYCAWLTRMSWFCTNERLVVL